MSRADLVLPLVSTHFDAPTGTACNKIVIVKHLDVTLWGYVVHCSSQETLIFVYIGLEGAVGTGPSCPEPGAEPVVSVGSGPWPATSWGV